jgi:hypothetical protein
LVAAYGSYAEGEQAAQKINTFLRDLTVGHVTVAKNVGAIFWITWLLVPVVAALLVALMASLFSNERSSGSPTDPLETD